MAQPKPILKQRTSQTIAAVVVVVIGNIVRKHFGVLADDPAVEVLINEEVVPAIVAALGGLAIWFRQKVEGGQALHAGDVVAIQSTAPVEQAPVRTAGDIAAEGEAKAHARVAAEKPPESPA